MYVCVCMCMYVYFCEVPAGHVSTALEQTDRTLTTLAMLNEDPAGKHRC